MSARFEKRHWQLGHGKSLVLGPTSHLMGVLNVTPDSFSDGGNFASVDAAVEQSRKLLSHGASIIDIGAESTKPGAQTISAQEEQGRLLPAIEQVLANAPDALISADTYRASTAIKAVTAGAHIINDVWGLQREPDIARVAAEHGSGLVIMHTNRDRTALPDVIEDQIAYFETSLNIAEKAEVLPNQIMLDPGFGFGKETPEMNLNLMKRFDELMMLDFPFLVGTSRKRFLGAVTGRDPAYRDVATAATNVVLRQKGAAVFRVHDVAVNADALKVCDAMLENSDDTPT